MSNAGILDQVLLIGSWCAHFYKRYFPYALQKLIIAEKRKNPDKAAKDRHSAFVVLDALIENGESSELRHAVENLSRKTLKTVVAEFAKAGRQNILAYE